MKNGDAVLGVPRDKPARPRQACGHFVHIQPNSQKPALCQPGLAFEQFINISACPLVHYKL